MLGRLTRSIALIALMTHIWASQIVAPWHHLAGHRIPAAEPGAAQTASAPVHRCHCGHHTHCVLPSQSSPPSPAPLAPDHGDDCPVCQVLAQPFAAIDVPAPLPTREHQEFTPPAKPVQPLLGAAIEPVSRGPPAV